MDAQTVAAAHKVKSLVMVRIEDLEHRLARCHDGFAQAEAHVEELKHEIHTVESELAGLRSWLHTSED